jgi:SAM-dependent methyltransferase
MTIELEPTGERVIEDAYHRSKAAYTIYAMHAASYRFVESLCDAQSVLDFGCGSGYGTARIAKFAARAVGVDIAEDAVAFARARYQRENLEFRLMAAGADLPFEDATFDVVLSFQVIEHVADVEGYLREIHRVLRPGGTFAVITPDRKHRLLPGQKPWNRWHVQEFSMQQLTAVVGEVFQVEKCLRMGAPWEVAATEIRRYRLARWVTLPFTLPFVPEYLRRRSLDWIHSLLPAASRVHAEAPEARPDFGFDETSFIISADPPNSMNLVLIAQRS